MLTSREIRQSFLDFFASKHHRIVPSAPVVPHGDPTLLFTNAGMNQFKDVFLGTGKRDYTRVADTQKCIRVSGKHNDLEEVGYDTYHHTLFEMLGNWSFGDYYKAEAIAWSWELLVGVWKLPAERLHATVYTTDDEAFAIWRKYLPEERIHRFAEKDNFWEMGETGPCGPCSEIHFDRTPDLSGGKLVNAGVPEVIEIWNNVFIQYNRKSDGSLEELPAKHVDTGMGFERICAVIQGKSSNYDTDVFTPILNAISTLAGKSYTAQMENKDDIAMRVIADHIRTLSFAVADGAIPSNEGRGYVLRRILRRAARYARNLGFREPMMYKLVQVLCDTMGDVFPEIREKQELIEKVIRSEEESFLQTLERGLEKFEAVRTDNPTSHIISGADAFLLYDTFGFPLDLTELLARENSLTVDTEEFQRLMNEQRERSRSARKATSQEAVTLSFTGSTEFTGYNELETESKVLFVEGNAVILEKSPFYVEMGGQVGDQGILTLGSAQYSVEDVKSFGGAIIHYCDRDVEPLVGDFAKAEVSKLRRANIIRNHSATHIIHEALRRVLGSHVQQAGSLVTPEYLRFDFPHFQKIAHDEIAAIEHMVNEKIRENIEVITQEMPIEHAKKIPNAKMFFGDKYGDSVRVVTIDENFSVEFCGGTHVQRTGEIGYFAITSQSSIAAGTRRIEAVTGIGMERYIQSLFTSISEGKLREESLHDKIRSLEKELTSLKMSALSNAIPAMIAQAHTIDTSHGTVRVVASEITAETADQLRETAVQLRDSFGKQGIALVASVLDGKVQLACAVTDDCTNIFPAGKLVGLAAKELGGGGGGKSHLATAGGKDVTKLPELLAGFPTLVRNFA